jgi:hypothetical protein
MKYRDRPADLKRYSMPEDYMRILRVLAAPRTARRSRDCSLRLIREKTLSL